MDKFHIFPILPLGKGPFGICLKAQCIFDGAIGCLKVYDKIGDSKYQRIVEEEYSKMLKLNHRNILTPSEMFWEKNQFCIFTEFASQGSLSDICNSPQSEGKVLQWARQVLRGLAVIHSNGIVHLDLKPQNILITAENMIKISDFGITRELLKNRLAAMRSTGDFNCIAPELLLEQPYGFPSDIFSLGVILYQLASGTFPFNESTSKKYEQSIRKGPSPLPSSISAEFSQLIFKMLHINPEKRPALLEILSHPLVQLGASPEAQLLFVSVSKPISAKTPFSSVQPLEIPCSSQTKGNQSSLPFKSDCFSDSIYPTSKPASPQASLSDMESLKIICSNGTKTDLYPYRGNLDHFENWVFVSSDFDEESLQIKFNTKRSIFIILDKQVTEIYQSNYEQGNKVLKSALIIHPLTILGENTFYWFSSLQSVIFPNTLKTLRNGCFSRCSSLRSISLPNSVTSLGNSCFYSCSSLQSFSLPPSLKKLGSACFALCSKLSYMFIPKSLVSVWSNSFLDCPKLFESVSGEKRRIEFEKGSNFTIEIIEKCQEAEFEEEIIP